VLVDSDFSWFGGVTWTASIEAIQPFSVQYANRNQRIPLSSHQPPIIYYDT